MKVERLNLKNIKNVLSRDDLKRIMAGGSGNCCYCAGVSGGGGTTWGPCNVNSCGGPGSNYQAQTGPC